ncbi:alpha/beta hydrolase-fold protein [Aquimarina sp. ERC-38]|uniref:alpha/beta hydrolase family esterase n=1 Tax=Aquimarina sp. ERC-38 TaxID=2949996 RepID=UPI0022455C2D|nr:PHB depolymerase family esterase [Aquimarina sp. ERC-38]UZO80436.1 alpha/beta hydrolase-fold protein [Aquimarina sp. ERC-38]
MMKKTYPLLIISIVLLLLSTSFSQLQAQKLLKGSLMVDGVRRTYKIFIPSKYRPGKKVPLLLNFHGYTMNAGLMVAYAEFRPIANRENFIVVYPQGLRDFTDTTHFNVGWGNSNVDDLAFTKALLNQVEATYSIDKKRIYSTGFSNGGFFSYKLACELSGRIAAIASVAGSVTRGQFANCPTVHQMPILEIHGTNDETVDYNGSDLFTPIPDVLSYWINFNNTRSVPQTRQVRNKAWWDGSTVTELTYSGGKNGAIVKHFRVNNGEHSWPGTFVPFGTNFDIKASREVWNFLSQYDINGLRKGANKSTLSSEGTEEAISFYFDVNSSILAVDQVKNDGQPYAVVSMEGKLVDKGVLFKDDNYINLSTLSTGMYVLTTAEESYKFIKK